MVGLLLYHLSYHDRDKCYKFLNSRLVGSPACAATGCRRFQRPSEDSRLVRHLGLLRAIETHGALPFQEVSRVIRDGVAGSHSALGFFSLKPSTQLRLFCGAG